MGTKILQAALALHEKVSSTFRKTAIHFHYEFTVSRAVWDNAGWPCLSSNPAEGDVLAFVGWPPPTPPARSACSHAQVRHLAYLFQGLLMSSPDVINSPAKWAKLWLHESERVYADRLVSQAVSASQAGALVWGPVRPLAVNRAHSAAQF